MQSYQTDPGWATARRHAEAQRWDRACESYRELATRYPNSVPAWLELSSAYDKLDRYALSRECVFRAAAAGGPHVEPIAGLAIARRLRRFEESERMLAYVEATNLLSRLAPERLIDLCTFMLSAGLYPAAEAALDRAERATGLDPDAHNIRGLLAMFAGDNTAAAKSFRKALKLRPRFPSVYTVLSKVMRATPESNLVEELESLLSAAPSDTETVCLAYALHNQLHDLREYEGAWRALERACAAKRRVQPYDHAAAQAIFRTQRDIFANGLPVVPQATVASPRPVFIVGMHRSGTTLLERILSGSPQISDAGETYTFTAQFRLLADHFCQGVADPELLSRARGIDLQRLGALYGEAIRWRARGRSHVTEKLNPNFLLLGQILASLPDARVLHMRRDPVDTCFSNLRTLFTYEATYSYSQLELADYYKEYVDLMDFWKTLAGPRILDVGYEALVEQPEARAREVAAHCGVEFVPEMLEVGREGGMVATASTPDVRAGILKDRGSAWRPYEQWLQPMLDRLAQHGLT